MRLNGVWLEIIEKTVNTFLAYGITEESQHRELDGPSANIALSDIMSNVLPLDGKKDKTHELNNVRCCFEPFSFHLSSSQRNKELIFAFFNHFSGVTQWKQRKL